MANQKVDNPDEGTTGIEKQAAKVKTAADRIKNFDVDKIKDIEDVKAVLKVLQKFILGDFS